MKNSIQIQISHQFPALIVLVFSTIILLVSCARKISFATSTVVPAATGTVKVKKDNNNNYAIKVDIKNLAEPNRLPQPQNVYVVWIQTENNGIQNLGQLTTSSGLFSGTLKASMETVTAYQPTRLFITGESAANLIYPGNYVVLNTSDF